MGCFHRLNISKFKTVNFIHNKNKVFLTFCIVTLLPFYGKYFVSFNFIYMRQQVEKEDSNYKTFIVKDI